MDRFLTAFALAGFWALLAAAGYGISQQADRTRESLGASSLKVEYIQCLASLDRSDKTIRERRTHCAEATGHDPGPIWVDGVRYD